MEIKDILAVGLSVVSIVISSITLYLTQFRRAKGTVSTGPMIHIFYVKPVEPTVFLRVSFTMTLPTKAFVYKSFLEIRDTKGDHFAMKWIGSVKIDLSNNYTNTELAGPFKIDGYETIPNALRFFWCNTDPLPQL